MAHTGTFVGLTTLDLIYYADAYPPENKKVLARGQGIYAGGPVTNAALSFALLGGHSRLVSAVGKHSAAALIRDDLDAASIELVDLAGDGFMPAISSIVVSAASGSRTVVSRNDAGTPLGGERFSPGMLEGASLLLVDGYHMGLATAAARAARKAGIHVVFDGGSWKKGTEALLEHVDTAICSEDFAPPHMAGAGTEAVLEFLSQYASRAAVTRGPQPVLFREGATSGEVPIPQVDVVDTLAAGDIFHGAYCHFYCAEPRSTFAELLRRAAEIASLSCRFFGPREWRQHY